MYFVLTKIVGKKHRNLIQLFIFHFWYVLVAQSCLTLCHPMDCSLPGSSVHGILQARILECVATAFSRDSSWARDWIQFSYISGRFFTMWATREAPFFWYVHLLWSFWLVDKYKKAGRKKNYFCPFLMSCIFLLCHYFQFK